MRELRVKASDDIRKILSEIAEPTTIYLEKGEYKGKFKICADGVTVIGAGRETTVFTNADYARKPHPDGREYNTFRTYTLCVTGKNVTLKNLTVKNANDKPEEVGQCVALSVNADGFRAENVDIISRQDSLFAAPFPDDLVIRYSGLTDDKTYYDGFIPRDELYSEGDFKQVYINCRVYGTVDYVFGCAEAYFINCKFVSVKEKRGTGFVAAPAHALRQETGFVFWECEFIDGGADENSVYLARPWRDFGKCEFIDCRAEAHINRALFDKWNDTYRDRTARFSYCGLDCGFTPSPVGWCSQIGAERKKELSERVERFKASE